ncbi:NADH-quinone oxidoreductase subunit N [Streptosporangiaceae bacterium NEAU-GS5]|nr:NADH-quinone oxidoreductase subunit N [Streptosporangiaceae bacterium NEAU-GS5]
MIQSIDYWAIAGPLVLALAAGLVLLLDAFVPSRWVSGAVTLAAIVAAGVVIAVQAAQGTTRGTFCIPGSAAGSESCSFVLDRFTLIFAGLTLAAGAVIVLLSMGELASGRIPAGEWYFLLLSTLTGAVLLPASRDLIMLVVSLELVSLPVFALTALRRFDGRASEAALKLFLVSVVSTAIMLFGVSLLYGLTGSVHLDLLAAHLRDGVSQPALMGGDGAGVLAVGVVLVLAGFTFKVAAVPFHFWVGDVYQGAPIPVAALLSVISKAAGFAGVILILTQALPNQSWLWTPIVAIVAALTMTVGNVLALRQRDAVRMLAWSSVAQSGYILAPLAIGSGAAASVTYLVFYAAMNLGAFAVVTRFPGLIESHRGLVWRSPVAALALAFFLICLAGLPPGLAGLFAKVVVFRELVDGGLGWLAVVMAINTVIGLYYYLAWTVRLFAGRPEGAPSVGSRAVVTAIGLTAAVAVAFSLAPQLVLSAVG